MRSSKRLVAGLAIAGCLLLGAAPFGQGRGGRGGPRARKTVLIWADTRNGIAQHDSVSHAMSVIERLGYESGAYDSYIRTDSNIISKTPQMTTGQPASGGPSLATVDAIFFLGHREVPLDDKQKAELLAFVKEDGRGSSPLTPRRPPSSTGPSSARCSAGATTATRGEARPAR
jgi:hypothetical protein